MSAAPELFPLNGYIDCVCGSTMHNTERGTVVCTTPTCERNSIEYERPTLPLQRARQDKVQPAEVSTPPPPAAPSVPLEYLRQTGRTHRMLAKAAEGLAAGATVTVVAASDTHAKVLREHMRNRFGEAASMHVKFISIKSRPLDFETMRSPGIDAEWMLYDHYALESRAAAFLAKLHEFDPPVARPPRSW